MRMIKAIQIDPFTCTINEVELDGDDYNQMYPLLSHPAHPVHCFTIARVDTLKGNDALYVDDNGLLNGPVRWFQFAGGYQPLAGMGLIIGTNEEGDNVSCVTSLALVRMAVVFAEVGPHHRLAITNKPWAGSPAAA